MIAAEPVQAAVRAHEPEPPAPPHAHALREALNRARITSAAPELTPDHPAFRFCAQGLPQLSSQPLHTVLTAYIWPPLRAIVGGPTMLNPTNREHYHWLSPVAASMCTLPPLTGRRYTQHVQDVAHVLVSMWPQYFHASHVTALTAMGFSFQSVNYFGLNQLAGMLGLSMLPVSALHHHAPPLCTCTDTGKGPA